MKNNSFNNAHWDKKNSTFRSEMMPLGWIGYSRRIGHDEKKDINSLLSNWILRLYRDGYLRDSKKPDIYELTFYHNHSNEFVIKLYKNHAEWNPKFLANTSYSRFVDFIEIFYQLINKNYNAEVIYDKLYVRSKNNLDPLSLEHHRFATFNDLAAHCKEVFRRSLAEPGHIVQFYVSYAQKFFSVKESELPSTIKLAQILGFK